MFTQGPSKPVFTENPSSKSYFLSMLEFVSNIFTFEIFIKRTTERNSVMNLVRILTKGERRIDE